jgi:hypothetical protein
MQPRNDKFFTLCSNSARRYGFSETLSTIFPPPWFESEPGVGLGDLFERQNLVDDWSLS